MESFIAGYIECAPWSSGDEFDNAELAAETLAAMRKDCEAFYGANETALNCDGSPGDAIAGHDFWLTRCYHGAGFWDGDWPEPYATQLTEASHKYGQVDLYLGDDGLIYQS